MLFSTKGRSTLRSAAVGSALLGAFAFASPANAALGGATPSNFTSSPNLVSVTANQAEETVVYKFDRAVAAGTGGLDTGDFVLAGYGAFDTTANPSSVSIVGTGDSVLADFGGSDIDFNSLTIASVRAGTVKGTITNSKDNFDDSTRITGATTESGTTGHTAGPDLVSATRNEDLEQITYTFDQAVDDDNGGNPASADFGYVDVNGNEQLGNSIVNVSGNRVIVEFTTDVSDATKATLDVVNGSIIADGYNVGSPTGAYFDAVTIAGAAATPATPNLLSASIDTNGGSVTYVFDKTITVGNATDFYVFLANGTPVAGTGTPQLLADAKSVRVSFALQNENEFAVFANIDDGAVTGATNAIPSTTDGAPIGGNAGAQAAGYTTAPDAIQALVNPAAGQASVLFDSRFNGTTPSVAAFDLYTADGVSLGNPSAVSVTAAAAPQQSRAVLTLTDTQATNAKNIVVNGFYWNGNIAAFGTIGTLNGSGDNLNWDSSLSLQATTGTFKK